VSGKYGAKGMGSANLGGDFLHSAKFMDPIFLRLFPCMYEKNFEFLGKEEVFGKVAARKGISEKEMSRGRKKSERRPSPFCELYEPHLFTPISLHVRREF